MAFKNLVINSLLIGLFVFCIISFGVMLSQENYTNVTVTSNPAIQKVFGNISKQLNESEATAQAQRQAMESESANPVITALGFVFRSILSAGAVFMTSVVSMFNVLFVLSYETLHISPIITGTILAIILVSLILAIWRLYRAGE